MNIFALNEPRSAKWLALVLFVITVISRIPFASQYMYHGDSVNMAFGMVHFNPLDGAPQFPGYIVYVVLAQILNGALNNHQTTMVIISIISSGLSVAALFYLGREMFNPITGLIAALFLVSSPLFWFYGEISLPHTLDLLAITVCVWMLYKIMIGQTRWLWWTTVLLALVGGFRQQDLLFLAPLAILAGYRIGLVKIIQVFVLGALVSVAWFIPLMAYSGGLQAYMAGSNGFTASFWTTTSIFMGAGTFGLKRNIIEKLIPYTIYAWVLAALPAVYWLVKLPQQWRSWLKNRKVWFFIIWIAPVLVFYAIIHMGQQGLVFVFMPAFFLVSAEGLYRALASRPSFLSVSTSAIVLVGIGIFLLAPAYPLGSEGPKLLTRETLQDNDELWHNRLAIIQQNFAPDDSLIVANDWRFVQYYLPDYQLARFTLGAKYEVTEGESTVVDYVNQPITSTQLGLTSSNAWRVVVLDDELKEFVRDPASLATVSLPNGFSMRYLVLKPDDAYWTDGKTFGSKAASTG